MECKHELSTIVLKGNGFVEYETLSDMVMEQGEDTLNRVVGYFPIASNVTFEEIITIKDDVPWSVCVIDQKGVMKMHVVESTGTLRERMDHFINKARSKDYVTFYKSSDLIRI